MKVMLLGLGLLLGLVSLAAAEIVTVSYTEPVVTGGLPAPLSYTTIYWCQGASCTDWHKEDNAIQRSDDGVGGDAKSVALIVRLTQGTLPITIRVKVTATDQNYNETSGVIATHTFN